MNKTLKIRCAFIIFPMKDGETKEDAEDRFMDALDTLGASAGFESEVCEEQDTNRD